MVEKKQGFISKLIKNLDEKLEKKSKTKKCCCCQDNKNEKC